MELYEYKERLIKGIFKDITKWEIPQGSDDTRCEMYYKNNAKTVVAYVDWQYGPTHLYHDPKLVCKCYENGDKLVFTFQYYENEIIKKYKALYISQIQYSKKKEIIDLEIARKKYMDDLLGGIE